MMDEMVFFYPRGHAAHISPGHAERPERVETVRHAFERMGWWQAFSHVEPLQISREFLAKVHAPEYLEFLELACKRSDWLDSDTYTTSASWRLALNAAGGAVAVARAVWQGQSRCGFALTRPPGHHAMIRRGMGFCLLNNIAIAAEDLIRQPQGEHPAAQRLAIIDLDLHHGNGTQDIFWERNDVLFISTHQSPLYPGSGHIDEVGGGPGQCYTANFPLPPGTGDQGFRTVMEELILPLLDCFSPQMLMVSFGFDPHWRDPLGHLMLSAAGYGGLIASLTGWADAHCQGKLALFLEGGYDLDAAAACSQAVMAAMLKLPWEDPLGPSPRPEGNSWRPVVHAARQIWSL